jgi:hypothetical protein
MEAWFVWLLTVFVFVADTTCRTRYAGQCRRTLQWELDFRPGGAPRIRQQAPRTCILPAQVAVSIELYGYEMMSLTLCCTVCRDHVHCEPLQRHVV